MEITDRDILLVYEIGKVSGITLTYHNLLLVIKDILDEQLSSEISSEYIKGYNAALNKFKDLLEERIDEMASIPCGETDLCE